TLQDPEGEVHDGAPFKWVTRSRESCSRIGGQAPPSNAAHPAASAWELSFSRRQVTQGRPWLVMALDQALPCHSPGQQGPTPGRERSATCHWSSGNKRSNAPKGPSSCRSSSFR